MMQVSMWFAAHGEGKCENLLLRKPCRLSALAAASLLLSPLHLDQIMVSHISEPWPVPDPTVQLNRPGKKFPMTGDPRFKVGGRHNEADCSEGATDEVRCQRP